MRPTDGKRSVSKASVGGKLSSFDRVPKPATETDRDDLDAKIERKLAIINGISTAHYQWGSFALTSIAIAVLINLDFHYILGGILTILGICILAVSIVFSVLEQKYANDDDMQNLLRMRTIYFWLVRVLLSAQIPFFLWAVVLMFEKA